MSLLKKLAGETAIYGLGNIASRVLNFIILTPYLSRRFLTGEFGIHATLYSYAAFLIVLFSYRMETTFFRFASLAARKRASSDQPIDSNLSDNDQPAEHVYPTALISILSSTLILVSFMIAFAKPIAAFIQFPDQEIYVIWFALILGFDALSAIPLAKLRLESRPIYFVIAKLGGVLVNAIAIIFFLDVCRIYAEQGQGWAQAVFQEENKIGLVFIANLLGSAFTLLLLSPLYFKVKFKFNADIWREMLRYATPLVVVGLAAAVNEVADRIFLQRLLPGTTKEVASQIGIYSGCYKFAILMTLFTQAFNYAAEPFFFRNANRSDAKQIYGQVAQAFALIGCLAFLGIWLYIDIIKVLIDESYHEGIKVVPILLLANLCLGLYYNFAIWYKLTDKTHIGAYIACAGALITFSLNFALIPILGYMGSAWATLACYAGMSLMCYVTGKRYYPIEYPIARMLTYIGFAVVLYLISLIVRDKFGGGSWAVYSINTIIMLVYIAGVFLLERTLILKLIKR